MNLELSGIDVRLSGVDILSAAGLHAAPGEFVGLVGPNGSGKSTLIRTVYRALRPVAGLVTMDGDPVDRLPAREVARRAAVVAQDGGGELDFTVAETVLMGRTPHKRPFESDTAEDREICTGALAEVGMTGTETRMLATLSGGERQRVLLARALAQRSRLLLLDEPTNHLDIRFQLEILLLVRRLRLTTVAALHDLNLAAAYCDRVYVLSAGTVVADGTPAEVLTPALLADVFGVRAVPVPVPGSDRLHLAFAPLPDPSRGEAWDPSADS